MVLYEPRSDQSNPVTEPDVLAPAAGAPHSEEFKLATIAGISGYKPLMGIPTGKRGRFDPLTCRCETGQLRVPLYDFRIVEGGDQANLWVTGQLGAADGRPLPIGCKAFLRRSKDGGTAFSDYWTGRVQSFETEGARIVALNLVDMAPTLNYKLGSGRPHSSASGVVFPSQLPIGLTGALGVLPAYRGKGPLAGKVKSTAAGSRYIELDADSRSRADNILTAQLKATAKRKLWVKGIVTGGSGSFNLGLRLHFLTGVTNKEATPIEFGLKGISGTSWVSITSIFLEAVPTGDPFYTALDTGTIANDTAVTFDIRRVEEPMYWVVATASQFLQDVAAGYHGGLDVGGAVKRRVSVNAAAIAALPSLPTDRWPVVPGTKAQDYLEKFLCLPRQLGYRFNESGEVVLFSTALPAGIGSLVTITDDDLQAEETPTWSVSQQQAKTGVRVNGYLDIPVAIGDLPEREKYPSAPEGLVQFEGEETELDYLVHLPRDQDLDESLITIDAKGLRAMEGETVYSMDRAVWVREQQSAIADYFGQLYGRGPVKLRGKYCDTANLATIYPGTWCLVNHTRAPNLGNHVRGGARLMLCTERSEDGSGLALDFLDAGAGVLSNSPTLGAPAQEGGNTKYGFTATITLNAQSDPVVVMVNTTATSVGSRPADTDPGWRPAFPLANAGTLDFQIASTGSQTFRINAPGKRHWPRAVSLGGKTAKLNSAFVYPSSGTGYVDTDAMTSVASVAVSGVSTKKATLTIVPGDSLAPIAILLGNGANEAAADASTPAQIFTLPAGATTFDLTGLDLYAGTWFRPQVAHLDAWGNLGPVTATSPVSFQATGTATGAPVAIAPLITRKGETVAPQGSEPGGVTAIGSYGIEFQIPAGPSGIGFDVELRRGTTSGALTLFDKVYAEQMQGRAYTYRDPIEPNNTTYYYDYRFVHPGYSPGAYSAEVSGKPGYLPPLQAGGELGEAVLGQVEEIKISASKFVPNTVLGVISVGWLKPDTTATERHYTAGLDALPPSCTIVGMILAGGRNGASDTAQLDLYGAFLGGVTVSRATCTLAASGASSVEDDAGALSEAVGVTQTWFLELRLKGNASVDDAWCEYARVQFIRNSYRQ